MSSSIQRSRRRFLKSAAARFAPAIIPGAALGFGRPAAAARASRWGASDSARRATATWAIFLSKRDAQVVAVCDVHRLHYRDRPWGKGPAMGRQPGRQAVDKHYAAEKASGKYKGCTAYIDFRELCGRADIDAVARGDARPLARDGCLGGHPPREGRVRRETCTHFFAEGQALYRAVVEPQGRLPGRFPTAVRRALSAGRGIGPQRPPGRHQAG